MSAPVATSGHRYHGSSLWLVFHTWQMVVVIGSCIDFLEQVASSQLNCLFVEQLLMICVVECLLKCELVKGGVEPYGFFYFSCSRNHQIMLRLDDRKAIDQSSCLQYSLLRSQPPDLKSYQCNMFIYFHMWIQRFRDFVELNSNFARHSAGEPEHASPFRMLYPAEGTALEVLITFSYRECNGRPCSRWRLLQRMTFLRIYFR